MREGWDYKKLGEVCDTITDGSHNPPKGISHSEYRMISSQNIFDDELRIDNDNVRYLSINDHIVENKRTQLEEGSVLLTIVGTIGRSCVLRSSDINLTLQRSVAALKPKEGIDSRFLMYLLIGKRNDLNNEAHGIAQKGIYLRQLSSLQIPLPPLSTQLAIVSELDKINELIRLKKEQLKDYDNLAQSIFYEMFGDPVENEKGWEVKKLEMLCNLSQGLAINKQTNHYLSDKRTSIPLLRIKDMKEGTREIFVKEDDCPTSCLAHPDDIIYTRTGTLGLAFTNMYGIMHNNCFKISINEELNKLFFMYYIQGEWFKNNIIRQASRSSQPDITHKLFLSQIMIFPPLPLQQLFASRITQIEAQKAEVQRAITDLETLLASRMQYWFE